MTTVVVAPNAFKGTLTAWEAAAAMAAGAATVLPEARIVIRPIADGGDGSVEALVSAGYLAEPVVVRDALGRAHPATIAVRDGDAVVELANTCGLVLLGDDRAPLASNTLGLGDAVRAALDRQPESITLCVGGSASTDGGAGLLVALGARILDEAGRELTPSGAALADVATVDLTGLDPRLTSVRLRLATDVSSPLLGPTGAARLFAPQKGANAAQVDALEAALARWAGILQRHTGTDVAARPGAGAAGGTAFAAMAALGARVVPGAGFIADEIGLDAAMASADLVITGEGSLDEQSLLGKGAVDVARRAQRLNVPTALVCGAIAVPDEHLASMGAIAWGSLLDIAPEAEAKANAVALLARRTVEVVAASSAA